MASTKKKIEAALFSNVTQSIAWGLAIFANTALVVMGLVNKDVPGGSCGHACRNSGGSHDFLDFSKEKGGRLGRGRTRSASFKRTRSASFKQTIHASSGCLVYSERYARCASLLRDAFSKVTDLLKSLNSPLRKGVNRSIIMEEKCATRRYLQYIRRKD